jgi:Flp pilus assembly protein TadG
MKRLQRLAQDESGMSYVFVGFGLMAMMSASILAIDVGMLMTARSQAQNSADAGALAGATALLYDSFTDRTPGGPAVTSAVAGARANNVAQGSTNDVAKMVTESDVEFLANPTTGQLDRVRVTVRRVSQRGNPVPTLIAQYFGFETVDIGASATAEAAPANAMDCVKPFTIPDKWIEKGSPPYDATDTFEPPDEYIPAYNDETPRAANAGYTGYSSDPAPGGDRGTELMIRAGTGNNISPSMYFSLAMTSDTGGSDYRSNIANCNTTLYGWGSTLIQEPGNMMGPTTQGIDDLIAQDPNARWNDTLQIVENSAFGNHSPRIFPIPLYDPAFYDTGKRNGRNADLRTANWIGFFATQVSGNNIYGRIVPLAGKYDRNGPAPNAALPRAIRLIQ